MTQTGHEILFGSFSSVAHRAFLGELFWNVSFVSLHQMSLQLFGPLMLDFVTRLERYLSGVKIRQNVGQLSDKCALLEAFTAKMQCLEKRRDR